MKCTVETPLERRQLGSGLLASLVILALLGFWAFNIHIRLEFAHAQASSAALQLLGMQKYRHVLEFPHDAGSPASWSGLRGSDYRSALSISSGASNGIGTNIVSWGAYPSQVSVDSFRKAFKSGDDDECVRLYLEAGNSVVFGSGPPARK